MRLLVRGLLAILCLVVLGFLGLQFYNRPIYSPEPVPDKSWKEVEIVHGLNSPWGISWLPDGRAVVTGKYGKLWLIKADTKTEVALPNLPPLYSGGQGGLLDIAPHPKFAQNQWLYMTMSTGTEDDNRTILIRGKLVGNAVRDIKTLFRVKHGKSGGAHFGSRLLWMPDGTLLMSIGDGGNPPQRIGDRLAREQAQNLGSHHGKLLRLTEAGKPAPGNPFLQQADALPEIWSYGHRNIQGLALDAKTKQVWATEHGPRGGDELNLVEPGKNYGWPIVTYGHDYVTNIPVGVKHRNGMEDPKINWTPSRGVCGLAFHGDKGHAAWKGNLFSGGLASTDIRRHTFHSDGSLDEEFVYNLGRRVRDVRYGPDGHLYVLTDENNGKLLSLMPE